MDRRHQRSGCEGIVTQTTEPFPCTQAFQGHQLLFICHGAAALPLPQAFCVLDYICCMYTCKLLCNMDSLLHSLLCINSRLLKHCSGCRFSATCNSLQQG